MALSSTTTQAAIVAAVTALPATATAADRWNAVIAALYTRIKADIEIQSQVASGIAVNIPSTSAPGAPSVGTTSAPGTATSTTVT